MAALAVNGFVDDRAVVDALFGSEAVQLNIETGKSRIVRNQDGAWISSRGAARRRISALLLGVGILPHTVATAWPTVWHHFDPTFKLTADLPFPATRLTDDTLQTSPAKASAADVFGLPGEWPGPEPAFKRCRHAPTDNVPAQLARA